MWSVLRRQQGDYYEKQPHVRVPPGAEGRLSKVDLALRTIAMHETKPYAAPQDPLVLTTPYGSVVYAKIVKNLSHENVVLRRQAVSMLLDLYLLKGEHVMESLSAGVLDALLERLSDPDDDMRTQACIALEFIIKQPKGQEVVLSRDTAVLKRFLDATEDSCSDVVVEALRLLASSHAVYNEYESTKRLVEKLGVVPTYVKKIQDRDDAVICTACSAAAKVFDIKEAFIPFITHGGVEAVTSALKRTEEAMTVVEACEVISKLGMFQLGLERCTKVKTIAALLPHIRHENVAVRTSSSAAVAQLVVHAEGKQLALESAAIDILATAVETEDERDVLMNLVKGIGLLSEHPKAREPLKAVANRLRDVVSLAEDYEPLRLGAQRALLSIEWVPGTPLP